MPENQNPGQKSHSHEAIPFQLPGEAMSIWRSLGSNILAQNWKSMWKPYTVNILYLMGKKFCYSFFRLCLLKIANFSKILTKTCFCPNYEMVLTETVKNLSQIWFGTFFINTISQFGQKKVLVKIFEKMAIFSKHSLKND